VLALLKSLWAGVGLKDYLYAAAILAVILAGSFYTIHERDIGVAERVAKDAKLSAAIERANTADQALAALQAKHLGVILDEAVNGPLNEPAPVVRLCNRAEPHAYVVPPAAGGTPAAGGHPEAPVVGVDDGDGAGEGPDIGPDILRVVHGDDATIAYLLGYIDLLEAEMRKAPHAR
jgi:hypothetical protein